MLNLYRYDVLNTLEHQYRNRNLASGGTSQLMAPIPALSRGRTTRFQELSRDTTFNSWFPYSAEAGRLNSNFQEHSRGRTYATHGTGTRQRQELSILETRQRQDDSILISRNTAEEGLLNSWYRNSSKAGTFNSRNSAEAGRLNSSHSAEAGLLNFRNSAEAGLLSSKYRNSAKAGLINSWYRNQQRQDFSTHDIRTQQRQEFSILGTGAGLLNVKN